MTLRLLAFLALSTAAASAQTGVVWTAAVPRLTSIDASADGTRLAVASGYLDARAPSVLRLRDAADGTVLLDLDGQGPDEPTFWPPNAVAIDETGSHFASLHNHTSCQGQGGCGVYSTYRVWSATGELLVFRGADYYTNAVDLHGGRLAVAVFGDQDVRVRDAATGDVLQTVGVPGRLTTLAFSPDSLMLVTGGESLVPGAGIGDGILTIHPLDGSPAPSVEIVDSAPESLAFSPDGTLVAVGTYSAYEDARVLVVRLADAAVLLNTIAVDAIVAAPVFTADGQHLVVRVGSSASSGRPDRLDVIRISDGSIVQSEPVQPSYTAIARIPGTNRIAYADGGTLVVRSFDIGNAVTAGTAPDLAAALTIVPNPSTGAATVRVSLPHAQTVRVDVIDALGRTAAVLYDGTLGAGEHALNVRGLAPGVYTVRVQGVSGVSARRLTVAR